MKRILLPLLICFQLSFAQGQADKLFTPEELKADADYYFKTLYSNHPDPYYYYSLTEFEDKKDKIYAQLNKPLTREQFANTIGEINSYVDGHSSIHIYYLSFGNVVKNDLLLGKINLFPIVKIKDDKLFLADDLKNNITEINGIMVSEILSDCRKYFNWKLPDKPNDCWIESWLPFLFHYKYKFTPPYQVKFRNSNKIKTIEKISLDEFLQQVFGGPVVDARGIRKNNVDSMGVYSYRIYPACSAAVFYINTFNNRYKDKFDNTLKKFITEVNNSSIKYIFYDLSKNDGGQCGGYDALDIIKHDTVYFKRTEIERHDGFNKKSNINDIVLTPNFDKNIPSDRKLFVFQTSSTKSRGDYFCRIVAENKLGVLVGEDTGEPTVAFSWCLFYTMPNSKIDFSIATTLIDFSHYFNSETLKPDIYWDIHNSREFTEKELNDIINYYKKNVQTK